MVEKGCRWATTPLTPIKRLKTNAPQQYNKKTVEIGQGVDVLKVWLENHRKQQENQRKHNKI